MTLGRGNNPGSAGEAPLRFCILRLSGFAGIVGVQHPNGLLAAPTWLTEDWA